MRRAARVDDNQAQIVAALRAAGAMVWVIGLPVDLLVGYRGRTILMEIKGTDGVKHPRARPHTELQRNFLACWCGGPAVTVTSVQEALGALQ